MCNVRFAAGRRWPWPSGWARRSQARPKFTKVASSLRRNYWRRRRGIVPGQPFKVGVLLRMVPHWHTYWKFPGDAGIPTEIKWNLPAGWKVGEIQWPIPLKLVEPGDIQIYGYHDEVLLIQEITPPASLDVSAAKFSAEVNWLVCEKICIPGGTVGRSGITGRQLRVRRERGSFRAFRTLAPASVAGRKTSRQLTWKRSATELTLQVKSTALANHPAVDFYPAPDEKVVVGHPSAERVADGVTFRIPIETSDEKLAAIPGVVVFGQTAEGPERNAWQLNVASSQTIAARARHLRQAASCQVPSLRFSRRLHFEPDAVRVAGDLAQDLRLHPTRGTEPRATSS